ncbi:MAG TPA: cyclase family protein [Phycisphaerae bacterium]|nr:cyclase family protein [Phycisphaerae bacterium]HNU46632.1 cyclase family protein [Phycisphaerae bacterium]
MNHPDPARWEWLDISVPLHPQTVHWPGDDPFTIQQVRSLERGDEYNLSQLSMSVHTGTHIDAPAHFLAGGATIDKMPPDLMVGPAVVIGIRDAEAIRPAELARLDRPVGTRVLFKTRNSTRHWAAEPFLERFVHLTPDAARFLVEHGVRVVGIDYLSIGAFAGDGDVTHRVLAEAGAWVIEGLNLSAIEPGSYELACLPLRIRGAEAAPARALLGRPVSLLKK